MKYAMIGVALSLASGCAAQTPPALYAVPEPGACEIRETRTANGLRLEALAHAGYDLRADYTFEISARSTDVTQGGPVDLAAGDSAVIGAAEIPRGAYRATLSLADGGGELCRRVRQS